MLTYYLNSENDQHVIVTTDVVSNYYILKIVGTRKEKVFNVAKVASTKRYVKLLLPKSLPIEKGEYDYYLYAATSGNDINTVGKPLLEQGLIKIKTL